MRDVNRLPLWMSPLPTGEGIRGEATVDDGHVRLIVWIAQIGEVRPQLAWRQQTLKYKYWTYIICEFYGRICSGNAPAEVK